MKKKSSQYNKLEELKTQKYTQERHKKSSYDDYYDPGYMDENYNQYYDDYYGEEYTNPGQYFDDFKHHKGYKGGYHDQPSKQHYRGEYNTGKFHQDFQEIPAHYGQGRGGKKTRGQTQPQKKGDKQGAHGEPKFEKKSQSTNAPRKDSKQQDQKKGAQQPNVSHQDHHDEHNQPNMNKKRSAPHGKDSQKRGYK